MLRHERVTATSHDENASESRTELLLILLGGNERNNLFNYMRP